MNRDERKRLRALCEAATPGPWPQHYVEQAVRHIARNCEPEWFADHEPESHEVCWSWDRYTDGPLIAAAVNALPRLLGALDRCDALAEEWERIAAELQAAFDQYGAGANEVSAIVHRACARALRRALEVDP